MALINSIIGKNSFEIIRDKIAIIIATELANQVYLTGNYNLDSIVYLERRIAPNSSEVDSAPLINVMFGLGDYDNQDITQTDGTYQYAIDVYTGATSSDTQNGDTRSVVACHQMMGVIRAILEASQYITLGFQYPFVMGRKIKSITAPDLEMSIGTDNLFRGRLILEVRVPEYQQTTTATLIDGSDTQFFIDITENGFYFVNDNY